MDVIRLILMTAATIFLYIAGRKIYNFYLFRQRVNKIPGPEFAIPFLGIAFEVLRRPKDEHIDWFFELSNKFKDGYFRTWIGTIAVAQISKPEHIEVILRSNTEITKSQGYKYLIPWLGRGLLTSTGSHWFHGRKLITPAFHFQILENFAEVMMEKAGILNNCIDREIKIHGDKPFDVFELSVRCALDIICETAMGVNIHAQEDIEGEYTKAVTTISSVAIRRFLLPWLMLDWIFYKTAMGKAYKAAIETSHELCTRVLQKKQQERKLGCNKNDELTKNHASGERKKKAFLDLLLEANEKDENPLTMEELRDQANTFLFAGHDTTGALVSWTLFCLGNHLDIQSKVHEELDEVLGDSDDRETLKRLPNLKYLEKVIKEVLRLYPSAPAISRGLINDIQIGDYIIPAGTILSIEIYQLHRNPAVWPDPLHFDPDRFLPENIKGRHPYAYLPFSAGPRNCIGQKYAMLEVKVILCQVLRNFTVKSVENHATIKKYSEVILRPFEGTYVHMRRR